jgi:hypothetical protein
VLIYLSNTVEQGITYSAGDAKGTNMLYSFSDASFAGDCSKTSWLMMLLCPEICAAVQAVKEIKYLRYQL